MFKVPRITTSQRLALTLEASEIVFDTNLKLFFGGDGLTLGGISLGSGLNFSCEQFTLTQTNIDDKQIILAQNPSNPNCVRFLPVGGIEQINGIDFEVVNNVVQWDGLGLDNFLEIGDIILIYY